MEYVFLLGRILLGGYFIMSGLNHFMHLKMLTGYAGSKGVMMPRESVMLSGLMMVLGGAGIVLGVQTVYSVYILVLFMVVVSFKMHQYWKITDAMAKMPEQINFMKNMAIAGALLMLLSIPTPWLMSLM